MITWIHQDYKSEPREGKATFGGFWVEDTETYEYQKRSRCCVSLDLDTGEYMWSVLGEVGHTKTLEKAQEKCQRILDLTTEFNKQVALVKAEED